MSTAASRTAVRKRRWTSALRCPRSQRMQRSRDEERHGQPRGEQHVGESIGKGRIENYRQPARDVRLASIMANPAGVCIQLSSARIQNAEIVVPSATRKAATACMRGETRCPPKSITPRNAASRKKANRIS